MLGAWLNFHFSPFFSGSLSSEVLSHMQLFHYLNNFNTVTGLLRKFRKRTLYSFCQYNYILFKSEYLNITRIFFILFEINFIKSLINFGILYPIWWISGITPGFVLRKYSYQTHVLGIQSCSAMCKASTVPAILSLVLENNFKQAFVLLKCRWLNSDG